VNEVALALWGLLRPKKKIKNKIKIPRFAGQRIEVPESPVDG